MTSNSKEVSKTQGVKKCKKKNLPYGCFIQGKKEQNLR